MKPSPNDPGSNSTQSLDSHALNPKALDPKAMAPEALAGHALEAGLHDVGAGEQASAEDELLVAYLDGELDPVARTQVEARLAASPSLRTRLQQLRSAWDLLDELPAVSPNPNFTQSTIEMVAISAANQESAAPPTKAQSLRRYAWLVLLPLALCLGYIGTRSWQRAQEQWAVEQLPVLADWDALEDVGSFPWLEKLYTIKDDLARVAKRAASNSSLGVGLVPKSNAQRRAWIDQLTSTDRDRLSANLEKFNEYGRSRSHQDRQRIIDLTKRIYASDDPEGLLATARSYGVLLSDMNVSDRTTHQDEPDLDKRFRDLQSRVNRKLVEAYVNELPADAPDRQAVEEWKQQMRMDYRGQLPGDSVEVDLARRLAFRDSIIDSDDLELLHESLSGEAREILGRLQDTTLQQMALIIYFVNPPQMRRVVDRSAAIEQFQKLPPERQAQLEFLPPDQVQGQLGLGTDTRRRPFRTRN